MTLQPDQSAYQYRLMIDGQMPADWDLAWEDDLSIVEAERACIWTGRRAMMGEKSSRQRAIEELGAMARGEDVPAWRCPDCKCVNLEHEAFCYCCGALGEDEEDAA